MRPYLEKKKKEKRENLFRNFLKREIVTAF